MDGESALFWGGIDEVRCISGVSGFSLRALFAVFFILFFALRARQVTERRIDSRRLVGGVCGVERARRCVLRPVDGAVV